MDTVSDLQELALEVCSWLERIPRTYAAPVVVKIGRERYAGATYAQVRDIDERTPAYAGGERYSCSRAMYLVGRLPYSYRRRRTTAYRIAGARKPWYIAGWYDTDAHSEYHPFGHMFLMFPDDQNVCYDDDGNPYLEQRLELIG